MNQHTFTVHRSPLTVRYPFTVIYSPPEKVPLGPSGPFTGWLMLALRNLGEGGANGKCMVNGKWLMVNGSEGAV